jgi:hypothetical protein
MWNTGWPPIRQRLIFGMVGGGGGGFVLEFVRLYSKQERGMDMDSCDSHL